MSGARPDLAARRRRRGPGPGTGAERLRVVAAAPATKPRGPERGAGHPPLEVVPAKTRVPALRPGLVSRTPLVNRLRATNSAPVATITAPAGYGKTTLLAQWAERDGRPVAWVSVDARDNGPLVLLRHFAAALDAIEPVDARVFDALAAPARTVWESAIPRVCEALAAIGRPLAIVFDDAHLLRSKDSLQAVAALADNAPEGSLLVLAGRSTPRIPIANLRAAGRLFEVTAVDLALTAREGHELLRAAGAEVSLGDAAELVRDAEGWPAALYLVALALREDRVQRRPAGSALSTPGGERHVADYIRDEYLARLRPEELRFLRRTSVLDQMCGPLCDAVLGQDDSARELAKIERSNLFLVPLDRERAWYRYHNLFRDVLRRDLAEREPELVPVLHSRAADWYEARGDAESALEQADAAGDVARAARILAAAALPLYFRGRVASVERWLVKFDDPPLLRRFPNVALQGGWVHALRGRADEATRWLEFAETGTFRGRLPDGSRSARPWISVVRAAMCGDGVYQMLADADSAVAALPPDSSVRPTAIVELGVAYLMLDEVDRADRLFALGASEAARVGATDTQVMAIGERALVASARDDVVAAEAFANEARAIVDEGDLSGYATTAVALAASARASLRHGRWAEARAGLARVEGLEPLLGSGSMPWLTLQTRLELVRAYLALRDTQTARALIVGIRELLAEHPFVGALADEAAALEREVARMPAGADAAGTGLTAAELRLLPFLMTHHSFREIGDQLFVSRNTIKTQAISVYRKLGVSSRSEAIERAAVLGLVEPAAPAA